MPKFELTMTTRYARDWGVREGLRELVQNMLDGHDDGYPMEVGWATVNGREHLLLRNRNLVLETSAWLLGKTSKDSGDHRGRHGDGLKVGTLALLRNDVQVSFLNGNERWTPALEYSETFSGEVVLTITTRAGSARQNDFTVLVEITREDWETYRQDYLPLSDVDITTIVKGGYAGDLILDPTCKGKVFVKGIWVCTKPTFAHGYDLHDVKLDRDRRVIDTWDLQYEAGKILSAVAAKDDQLLDSTFKDLVDGSPDGEYVYYADGAIRDQIAARFKTLYGDNAVPVETAAEATQVEHYGLRGIVVPKGLRAVLEHVFGDLAQIIRKAIDATGEFIQAKDLDPDQRKVWNLAINLISLSGIQMDPAKVRIFQYRAPGAPMGTFHPETGEVRVNPVVLSQGGKALVTLVHELAHPAGPDGSLSHRDREERYTESVIDTLLSLLDSAWLTENA